MPPHPPPHAAERLWEVSGRRRVKYQWDAGRGKMVAMADVEEEDAPGNRRKNRLRERLLLDLQCTFLPSEEAVTGDYWNYAKWRFVQRISSSCMQVLSTQAMLHAVGVGGGRVGGALPAAAALSWVLKDGLGKVGKLVVNASFANDYDAYAKRSRFLSSVGYTLAIGAEMATPLVPPALFLGVAATANVMKSVGTTVANTVRMPIQKSFATRENTGEIAARTGTQQVVADNLGLLLAIFLSTALMRDPRVGAAAARLPTAQSRLSAWAKTAARAPPANARRLLYAYPPLALMDLGCIYLELKSVHLRTLNPERLAILAEHYVQGQPPKPSRRGMWQPFARRNAYAALTPGEVSRRESLWGPLRLRKPSDPIPLHLVPLGGLITSRDELRDVVNQHAKGRSCYLVYRPPGKSRSPTSQRGEAALAIAQGAPTTDVVQSMLQVAYLRALPFQPDLSEAEARLWAIRTSHDCARREGARFMESLRRGGWDTYSGVLLPRTTYFTTTPPVTAKR